MKPGRLALLAGGAAASAWVARGIRRRHPAVANVHPELRSPVLYAPLSVRDERSLRIGRRLFGAATTRVVGGVESVERILDHDDGQTRVVSYETPGRTRPSGALVWIHGGGLVMGRPEQANEFASRVARDLDLLVVNVDYRLAPEHPFPAGLDDCMVALWWLHDRADELGVDRTRIAVGGDSAGGGLAAAVAQRSRDEGGPPIAFQALVYPMLDDRTVLRTDHDGRGEFIWTPVSNRFAWTAYLGHPPSAAPERPYAAPARTEDLAGLPPAWVGVGDLDLFHDEDLDYARRLEAAGVPCELRLEEATYHAADNILPGRPTSRAFRESLVAALRTHTAPGTL